MKQIEKTFDIVVCGGGMAGFCAAVAAARKGAKTCLLQDRPVLGGNASSEVRVTVHGAACHHPYMRETGILGEAMNDERRMNHLYPFENGWTNSVHDMALYNIAVSEPNLELCLNTSLRDVQLEDGSWGTSELANWPIATEERGYSHRPTCHEGKRIQAVRGYVANAETELTLKAKQFIDCTGDALLGHLAGCEWRWGSESREETGEIHAAPKSSLDTMGNSIHIRCIDTGKPAPFTAPEWAMHYDDAAFFYEQGRRPNDPEGGFWWIEIGVPWNTVFDNETIRHELTRHALGVWDWMKNKDPKMKEKCRNYALEFIGQVPGKRESRRLMGLHFLNENELQGREDFPDVCAYGGWFIDLHTPGGLLAPTSEEDSAVGYDSSLKSVALKLIGPYGIPLRSLISKDVPNLSMAGRNISTTHAALGTVRVMATCGLMGQAIGTAAAQAVKDDISLAKLVNDGIKPLQQQLLRDGCYLPDRKNEDTEDLAQTAKVLASSERYFGGLGLWDEVEDRNLRDYVYKSGKGHSTTLEKTPCQWFYMAGGSLDQVGLALSNTSEKPVEARAVLRQVKNIWDYESEGAPPVWESDFQIPSGFEGMLYLETALSGLSAGCYRLEIYSESAEAAWLCSSNRLHGICGGHIVGSGRFHWNRLHGEFAFQLEPAQPIFSPSQVLSGVNRPTGQSNMWLSEPSRSLPQWLELTWEETVSFQTVELNFPTQLLMETHWENPFYVAPNIADTYRIQAFVDGGWKTLLLVEGNTAHRRQHRLEAPVETSRLRILIERIHGGQSAGLTEIRVYP